MPEYAFTEYFERKVLVKRPYLRREWCIRIIESPLRREVQPDGERVRFWGRIDEFDRKVFRVVTLADETIIHNAFPDRGFKP
ncbi:MAG: hypothetical protein ACFB21_01710 [Opitutales bacterium]